MTAQFHVGDVVFAGRPPTFYCSTGKKEYLGKVVAILPPERRQRFRYVIQFNEPDANGDTDTVTVPHHKNGKVVVFRAEEDPVISSTTIDGQVSADDTTATSAIDEELHRAC